MATIVPAGKTYTFTFDPQIDIPKLNIPDLNPITLSFRDLKDTTREFQVALERYRHVKEDRDGQSHVDRSGGSLAVEVDLSSARGNYIYTMLNGVRAIKGDAVILTDYQTGQKFHGRVFSVNDETVVYETEWFEA